MPHQDHPPWILDNRRALGDRIRDCRMRQNLTQDQLAEIAEVSRDTIQRIEGGQNDAKVSFLWKIAKALDVSLADLVRE
ncbi:helix-turn-helix transcriptional regulator [Streptomyces sp. NPDC048332]|uniref:helix-turn-helix domain-containing protein n=1 Tax=Streptomyces sp. NPDC048332 TaxID=3154619 RepID=UPI0034372373